VQNPLQGFGENPLAKSRKGGGYTYPTDHSLSGTTAPRSKAIGLKSLQEAIDTSASSGKLIFHLFGALAEFERNLIREKELFNFFFIKKPPLKTDPRGSYGQDDVKRVFE